MARIVSFKGGQHTQDTSRYILESPDIKDKKQAELMHGKKVEFATSSGKKIVGKIKKAHGNQGKMIAKFRKGLPGQAIGQQVEIL